MHEDLETRLAGWFGAERALVFGSGYLANLGALGALLGPGDAVAVDRLAHASLLDAARATKAAFRVFQHNDAAHLADVLASFGAAKRRLVVTEGLFSMDGDHPPLDALTETAASHGAVVYLDDAHGAFAAGSTGRGSPEALGVPADRVLYMGAMGKALGAQGGFIAGPAALIDYLANKARTFIYSTAPAVPVVAAAAAALSVLEQEPERRTRLRERAHQLAAALGAAAPETATHIQPVIAGESSKALELSAALWSAGHWAPAIRPPTVADGTARLRLSVTALHTNEQIAAMAAALRRAGALPERR